MSTRVTTITEMLADVSFQLNNASIDQGLIGYIVSHASDKLEEAGYCYLTAPIPADEYEETATAVRRWLTHSLKHKTAEARLDHNIKLGEACERAATELANWRTVYA